VKKQKVKKESLLAREAFADEYIGTMVLIETFADKRKLRNGIF